MQAVREGYKVLSTDWGRLVSAVASMDGCQVSYRPGEFVGPLIKGTPLMVFDREHGKDAAFAFAREISGHVYLCEYLPFSFPYFSVVISINALDKTRAYLFWSYVAQRINAGKAVSIEGAFKYALDTNNHFYYEVDTPQYTRLAESVRILYEAS